VEFEKRRVLYVADQENTCEIMAALLARHGYEVVAAHSLVTALLVSRGQPFNLYVLDAQFWGGAGARLCRSIREFDPLAPIIIFSSAAGTRACGEALEAGATCYVLKPNLDELLQAVNQVTSEAAREPARGGGARL
jgi:DNA-binding response OmpR family regulator